MTGRPRTTADLLAAVADWVEHADRSFGMLASLDGGRYDETPEVPADLRTIAGWLAANPDTDRAVYKGAFCA